jgi:predicted glycoside hydrolase/deacetylase ChbG (UPF0249 family)
VNAIVEQSVAAAPAGSAGGMLIINADDWGCDDRTTDMIADCVEHRAVSSVSAMVFMADSERAAALARRHEINAGLHLNFTTPFSSVACPSRLAEQQRAIAAFLRSHRFAQVVFHPGLARAFAYVVAAQVDEFRRLYGHDISRVDGHHHMHLCANVLFQHLLPPHVSVRRSFSLGPGEKGRCNRLYRQWVDKRLLRDGYRLTDFFFSISPMKPTRLNSIFSLARRFTVELECHPVQPDEYRFLMGEMRQRAGDGRIPASGVVARADCALDGRTR